MEFQEYLELSGNFKLSRVILKYRETEEKACSSGEVHQQKSLILLGCNIQKVLFISYVLCCVNNFREKFLSVECLGKFFSS